MAKKLELAPPQGWPAVWWEIIIVTIGVFIALAAQQYVDRASSRDRAQQALARIELELDENQGAEIERVALRKCLTIGLRNIAAYLKEGTPLLQTPSGSADPQDGPALAKVYQIPSKSWITDAYDEALAEGDLENLDAERRLGLAQMYTQIRFLREMNAEEEALTAKLAPLQFSPVLSSGETNDFIASLARLDHINEMMVLVSRQTFQAYRDLGFADTPEEMAYFRRSNWWQDRVADWQKRIGPCVDAKAIEEIDPQLLPESMR